MRVGDPAYDEKERLLRRILPPDVASLVCEFACERGCYGPLLPYVCDNPLHYRPMSCCGRRTHVDDAFHSDIPPRGCPACQQDIGYPTRCTDFMCACHRNSVITQWWNDG